ncbi:MULTISPECIES: GAF domain-containing protein [Mycobacterium]|uniref:GAF domain-containing protein n=1 Tax=Mycobacterium TaxID=1763 RepID=UPI001CD95F3C|nr:MULTISPECIES: GAF domain-containing protein [Mycobacterium]MCA2241605.1 ANTAR domain-containing protein [Mycobacterium sp. WUMAC-067]MCA2315329.1 ANTAR domain-containing protein [Mycobacterium sp. WUMAC-025]MEE3752971.1 GAF domain-containing protein [Mycobacterium intracellulare]
MTGAKTRPDGTAADVESQRLAAVRRFAILDTPRDGVFDRVAAIAARMFNAPFASVTIVDEDRIWFKAIEGLPEETTQIGRDPGLCASAILQDEPYVIPDTLRDPKALDNPLVRGELGIRFYAAAPIITPDGHRLGTVNVLDTHPGQVTPKQTAGLQLLAGVVMEQLELWLATQQTVRNQEASVQAVLSSRADTDRAVGMIMHAQHCDSATAWNVLRDLSQRTNIKVHTIAEIMGRYVCGGDEMPLDREQDRLMLGDLLYPDDEND